MALLPAQAAHLRVLHKRQTDGLRAEGVVRAPPSVCFTRRLSSTRATSEGRYSSPDTSLLHPDLQRQWDHAANAHLGNTQIKPHSQEKVCWTCDECPLACPHQWKATVASRTHGAQCPFCANRQPCQHNSLATNAPAITTQFSNKNEGTPHDYTVYSNKKVLWQCGSGHEWNAKIAHRTAKHQGCPSCYNTRRCDNRVQHPFLSDSQHPMMQCWDWKLNVKAGFDPSKITCRSQKKVHWICPCCPKKQPHRWQATVGSIFNGSGCPCCSGHKACTCNSLQSLAPEMAAEWDYARNKGSPSDYPASSHTIVWWQNDRRGSFQARLDERMKVHKRKVSNEPASSTQVHPPELTYCAAFKCGSAGRGCDKASLIAVVWMVQPFERRQGNKILIKQAGISKIP